LGNWEIGVWEYIYISEGDGQKIEYNFTPIMFLLYLF